MKHPHDSLRRINAQPRVNPLCLVGALLLLSLTSIETHASGILPVGEGTGSVGFASDTQPWLISHRLPEKTETQDAALVLHERPENMAPVVPASRQNPAADTGRPSHWIDQGSPRFTFDRSFQHVPYFGPAQPHAGAIDAGSNAPVVPISTPPSSGLLFMTALVGMLGTVTAVRGEARFKRSVPASDVVLPRRGSAVPIVVLTSDGGLATQLEGYLHRAGYEARVAATPSEIVALTDPASLLLVLVDCRTHDWDMLRTDSSLRHVLLMAVVPPDCFYTECHVIADLERGMDGIYEMHDGHRLFVAKVGAYLRRARCASARRGVHHVGAIELDGDAHEVTIAGRPVKLTTKPFAILSVLMREPSKVFSRSKLIDLVWGPDIAVGEHTVDVHVHVLRQLLDREPHCRCELLTINRIGFTLRPVAAAGSIRTNRLRPISHASSDSQTRARTTPGTMSKHVAARAHRLLMGPPLNTTASACIAAPCG